MNNSTTYSWQGAYRCAVLETDPARMAERIDAALRAIEQRVGSTARMDRAENEAIESARNGLAVLRGEWFGGLSESMTGTAPALRMVVLDLFRTLRDEKEWLGTFQSIDSARTVLSEMSSARPGHYVIFDQTTGEEIFAESNFKDSSLRSVRRRTQL
jgi:hypothetical protein